MSHHECVAEEGLCVVYGVLGDVQRGVGPAGDEVRKRAARVVDE
jgi:hypothetical protein